MYLLFIKSMKHGGNSCEEEVGPYIFLPDPFFLSKALYVPFPDGSRLMFLTSE